MDRRASLSLQQDIAGSSPSDVCEALWHRHRRGRMRQGESPAWSENTISNNFTTSGHPSSRGLGSGAVPTASFRTARRSRPAAERLPCPQFSPRKRSDRGDGPRGAPSPVWDLAEGGSSGSERIQRDWQVGAAGLRNASCFPKRPFTEPPTFFQQGPLLHQGSSRVTQPRRCSLSLTLRLCRPSVKGSLSGEAGQILADHRRTASPVVLSSQRTADAGYCSTGRLALFASAPHGCVPVPRT